MRLKTSVDIYPLSIYDVPWQLRQAEPRRTPRLNWRNSIEFCSSNVTLDQDNRKAELTYQEPHRAQPRQTSQIQCQTTFPNLWSSLTIQELADDSSSVHIRWHTIGIALTLDTFNGSFDGKIP
jgi:hypothetical protein